MSFESFPHGGALSLGIICLCLICHSIYVFFALTFLLHKVRPHKIYIALLKIYVVLLKIHVVLLKIYVALFKIYVVLLKVYVVLLYVIKSCI